ncbi:hypothetical protein ACFH1V_12725 [Acinetobacter baumannii]
MSIQNVCPSDLAAKQCGYITLSDARSKGFDLGELFPVKLIVVELDSVDVLDDLERLVTEITDSINIEHKGTCNNAGELKAAIEMYDSIADDDSQYPQFIFIKPIAKLEGKMLNLSNEQVNLMGNYDLDKIKYLNMFKTHQDDDGGHHTTTEMWGFLNQLENYLYHFASNLAGEQYKGGLWSMDNGFFILNGAEDTKFTLESSFGNKYELSLLEFSIVVNLFALSHLCFWAHDHNKTMINNLAVFFSDYVKETMKLNEDYVQLGAIYTLID